jgi:hypothetical protein
MESQHDDISFTDGLDEYQQQQEMAEWEDLELHTSLIQELNLEADHFIQVDIWSVRKMLPVEYHFEQGRIFTLYIFAWVDGVGQYYTSKGYDYLLTANLAINEIEMHFIGGLEHIREMCEYTFATNRSEVQPVLDDYHHWRNIIG